MDKRVFVHRNEAGSEGKVVCLEAKDTMAKFKRAASKKLGLKQAKRIFLSTGAEITHVSELQNDDILYISEGEVFFKNAGNDQAHEVLQVSVLGCGGVGKSALTLRFVRDFFVKDWDPTIEDAYRKTVEVDGQLCMLEVLDTAGQDDFECLRAQWMMDKDGYFFIFSTDSLVSLQELQQFYDLHLQINEHKRPLPPIIMIANKIDIVEDDSRKRQVSSQQGRDLAELYNAKYIETSAKNGTGVDEAFKTFIREVRKQKQPPPPKKKWCFLL